MHQGQDAVMDTKRRKWSRVRPALLAVAGMVGVAGCDVGLLDVDDSAIIVPSDLDAAGPSAIPTLTNGVVGAYHEAVDGIVRYSGLLADEMILAGTFPSRTQVDNRRILPTNNQLGEEVYIPLHQARFQADTTAHQFEQKLEDPEFSDAIPELRRGIAMARLYGGFTRLWLGELYCWSILTGMFPETAPVLPDQRIAEALEFLEAAEAEAEAIGLVDIRLAAVVGQARANLWLGNFERAAELAAAVPRGWRYRAEYSANNPDQYNEVYAFTWGDTELIRWTVGDGSIPQRGSEQWPYLGEFIGLNLITYRPPGFSAFVGAIPVARQNLYHQPQSDILVASWTEAALILAEVAVRDMETSVAQAILNDLRSDYSGWAALEWGITPPDPENELAQIELTGDITLDLGAVVAERARELWLTGDRHVTGRRLRLDPAVDIDIFPVKVQVGGGDDIAFPIEGRELDNNPNLASDQACPAGQAPGAWR